jgi:hypothetical protein
MPMRERWQHRNEPDLGRGSVPARPLVYCLAMPEDELGGKIPGAGL